ncbi:MAG TPA: hypothetical protein VGQ59_09110 [Cyclobacteriaceae bacterium]|nr:hypothetical protein [Cyclobacteriaceae bacterium]
MIVETSNAIVKTRDVILKARVVSVKTPAAIVRMTNVESVSVNVIEISHAVRL